MLSRAQEARVREVLANHPPGTIQTYCLEHLAAAVKIPVAHFADPAAFIRNLQASGAYRTQYGGTCGSGGHPTPRILVSGRLIPPRQEARRAS